MIALLIICIVIISADGHVNNNACYGNKNNVSCQEANLDVQYLLAISQDTPTIIYNWERDRSDLFAGFIMELSNIKAFYRNPLVISISYAQPESQISSALLRQFNVEALKLAAQGVTLIAASGDYGANCGDLCSASNQCGYAPYFPASSPYVTAVGATQVSIKIVYTNVICTLPFAYLMNFDWGFVFVLGSRATHSQARGGL